MVKTKVVDINDNPPVMALEEINGGVSVDAGDDFEIQVEATDADTPVRRKNNVCREHLCFHQTMVKTTIEKEKNQAADNGFFVQNIAL